VRAGIAGFVPAASGRTVNMGWAHCLYEGGSAALFVLPIWWDNRASFAQHDGGFLYRDDCFYGCAEGILERPGHGHHGHGVLQGGGLPAEKAMPSAAHSTGYWTVAHGGQTVEGPIWSCSLVVDKRCIGLTEWARAESDTGAAQYYLFHAAHECGNIAPAVVGLYISGQVNWLRG